MGLGEKVRSTLVDSVKDTITDVIEWFEKPIVNYFKKKVALGTFDTSKMPESDLKTKLETLKKDWSHSPEGVDELFNDILDIVKGQTAQVQMEELLGQQIEEESPMMNRLFWQMGLITTVTELSEFLGLLGSAVPFVHLDTIGEELRSYLDYSGITQLTGFGYGQLLNTGIGPQLQQEIRTLVQGDILDSGTLRLLYIREVIDEKTYASEMHKWGLNDDRIKQWTRAALYYPSGGDFIRYAVRDVFNPEAVESGKLLENFPSEILPHALKSGMTEDILKWEWAAHWELPSPRMGYEMLHRGLITVEQLETLLRVSDFAPGWIDNLVAISYNPLTRVDARRFYESGVLTEAEYLRAMKDVGYSDLNAQRYVDWVNTKMSDVDRDLTRSQVLTAYKLDIMTKKDTIKFLDDLGYDKAEAEFIVALEDEKERLKDIKDSLEILRFRYAQGELTVNEFTKGVEALNLPVTKAAKELIKAKRARTKGIKLPSKEDVLKWHKEQKITTVDATDKLQRIGYQADDIKMYLGVTK